MTPGPETDFPPPPPGFVAVPDLAPGGFDAVSGGFLVGVEAGQLVGGFRVTPSCCNRAGLCHGGKLAGVCDAYLAMAALFREDLQGGFLPTVSLGLDFMAPVPRGVWVELRAETLRITRSLVFVQGLVTVEGTPAARADAIYHRLPPGDAPGPDIGALLRGLLGHATTTRGGMAP
ncbi:PaaI family thioesterase [Gluconacetobacter tumulisoli]|uniref:PaaI family thioesterase n=1 Tax=Gluconacetobacter tumulisoli TaxID=1286189 RepID=A0A7W4K838_9PROT|nr:PaaI family thioesterase [Gluconacetobacter tumulisoli]MBB2202022.1 PaaI family thioesterase [Gluconacetobacter tumulisoli]